MDSRFDGLRSILGNPAVAIPEVPAPAVASNSVAPVAAPAPARGMDRDESDESLELDEAVFGALPPPTVQQRATTRAADVRSFPRAQRQAVVPSERCVSGWAVVAVMALGLFLGGTAAMAVFHNDAAHILARLQ